MKRTERGKKSKNDIVFTNRRVEVRFSRTVNLGDYESARVEGGLSCDIGDNENLSLAYDKVMEEVENFVLTEIANRR